MLCPGRDAAPAHVMITRFPVFLSLTLLAGGSLLAQEWPQFLGPDRNGRYSGPPISAEWGANGPVETWRRSVGAGFAGPVVAEGVVIVFHRVNDREVVEAVDPNSGRTVWRHAYATAYRDDFGFDEGPRAAPVVVDGRVFTFGAQGRLHALNVATGEVLWEVDTKTEFGFRKGFFGAAGSPVVEGGRVIANIGGNDAGVVAFDAESGAVVWTALDDDASYSSGVGATFGGARHAVFLTRSFVAGLDPADGTVRFSLPWRSRLMSSVNAATPLVIDDLIFVSASYGTGAGLFRVDGSRLEEVWASDDIMSNHYATSVYHEGHLYGYHGRQEYSPSLRAVELQTGEVKWEVPRFGAGTVTVAGDRLVIIRETGELLIADASPRAFAPIATAQILPSVVRAYPALADGRLYVRNEGTLVCVDLRAP